VIFSCKKFYEKHSVVKISYRQAHRLATELVKSLKTGRGFIWDDMSWLPAGVSFERILDYLVVVDAINFCFWHPDPAKKWRFGKWSGSVGLAYAFKKYFEEEKVSLADFQNFQEEKFLEIIGREGELLMVKERIEVLRSVARGILIRFGSSFNLLKRAYSIRELVMMIANVSPYFYDYYPRWNVYFFKKAQLLARDIDYIINRFDYSRKLDGIEQLSALADYKLPQLLSKLGILVYPPDLAKKNFNRAVIEYGSKEEASIRAAAVLAVEMIKEMMNTVLKYNVSSVEIDRMLWWKSKNIGPDWPHHLTYTYYY